jgi:hypothetical protein
MHFDGPDKSTSFIDVKGHTVSAQGAAEISTTSYRFGGASGYFQQAVQGAAYLTVPPSADWDLTAGDSTVEMWIDPDPQQPSAAAALLSQSPTTVDGEWLIDLNGGGLNVQDNGGANSFGTNGGITDSAWQHIAVVRYGGTTMLFINGSLGASDPSNFYTTVANPLFIAAANTSSFGGSYCLNGYIDELRITKGVARYTAAFTPPGSAFPDCP